jgi:hypothetical protein
MKVTDYKGYEVHIPSSGGKAGKGCNLTSSIQMRKGGRIAKQFRFSMTDAEARSATIAKARKWADAQPTDSPATS